MTDQSPQNAEKPSDDVGRDRAVEDEGRRRWAYLGVKVIVLIVVAGCLIGANVMGVVTELAPANIVNTSPWVLISFGCPLEWQGLYTFGEPTEVSLCVFAEEHQSIRRGGAMITNRPGVSIDIAIALALLLYLSHVLNVVHRRWKPKYQLSLFSVVVVFPAVVGGVMALAHYGLVSWRRCFLAVVYGTVLICVVCLIVEIWGLVMKRKSAG